MAKNEKKKETALETRLLDEAATNDGGPILPVRAEDRAKILATINQPNWNRVHGVGDWREQVPDIAKDLWDELTIESKLIVFIMASAKACREADDYYDARERDR